MNTNLNTSPETSKQIPSAVEMAKNLITSKPGLFKNDFDTQAAIALALIDFYKKCDHFLHPPLSAREKLAVDHPCAICGGEYGIHKYDTMQCQKDGIDIIGQRPEWVDTTFQSHS